MRPDFEADTCLDSQTGEVVAVVGGWSEDHGFSEQELAEGLATGRLLRIEPLPLDTERGWMCGFTKALPDGWARDALEEALEAPGPMRRFEETLGRFPQERIGWLACREAKVQAVLAAWLEANALEPTAPPPLRRGRVLP